MTVSFRLTTTRGPPNGTAPIALAPEAKRIVSVLPALTVSVTTVSGANVRVTVSVRPTVIATVRSESVAGEIAYPGTAGARTKYGPKGRLRN
jgi:hypothetical protein